MAIGMQACVVQIIYILDKIIRGMVGMIFYVLWQLITLVQLILAYGTAYRLTKSGSDNGAALFGWFFVLDLASLIPGLGIYLWFRYKDT